jgi:hypothetical protein
MLSIRWPPGWTLGALGTVAAFLVVYLASPADARVGQTSASTSARDKTLTAHGDDSGCCGQRASRRACVMPRLTLRHCAELERTSV